MDAPDIGGAVTDRDPWVAIVRAARDERGVCLSAAEARRMVRIDDAIRSAAETCGTECVCDIMRGGRACSACEAANG